MEEEKKFLKLLKESNFQKRLKQLKKKFKNKRIILYAMGKFFKVIKENYDLSDLNIIGVSDLKFQTDGQDFLGYKTIQFKNIININPDIVLVSAFEYHSIINNFKNFYFANSDIKIIPLYKKPFIKRVGNFLKKISKSKTIKNQKEIENLKSIVNNYIDIKTLPKAVGELRELQLASLKILDTIDEICKNNNLNYWLDSGTLLGAHRHQGYIPWDDDIDICMLREEYNKISSILETYYENSDFYIRKRAITTNDFQIRIVNRFNPKIALDIFPIDSYFKSDLIEEEKKAADKLIKKARLALAKKYPKTYISDNEIPKIKKDIIDIQNKIIMQNQAPVNNAPALFFGIDFPYKIKGSLIFNYSTIFPLRTLKFEDREYLVPNDTEEYLKNLFGEFMSFPSGVFYSKETGFKQNLIKEKRR